MFNSPGIDFSFGEHIFILGGEVFAPHGDDANLREVAGCERKECTGTAQYIFHTPRRRGNGVEGNRTYGKDAHYVVLVSRYFSRISLSFSRVAGGILSRSVRIACAKAAPHLQFRLAGIEATVWRTTRQGFSVFFSSTATIS